MFSKQSRNPANPRPQSSSRPLLICLLGLVAANLLAVYFTERDRIQRERDLQTILMSIQLKDNIIDDLRFQIVRMHGQNQAYRALLERKSPTQRLPEETSEISPHSV